jgi:surfeit locus 1 family protein
VGVSRYRWALRPWWIVSHLFVLSCILVFARLGVWQLDRLSERRVQNELIAARQAGPPVPIDRVLAADADAGVVEDVVYRHVSVSGSYRADEQVLVRNQTYNGAPGYWVVTPLVMTDGTAVAVQRGWVPMTVGEGDGAAFAPPTGPVTVTGLIARSQVREGLGVADPEGTLEALARVDVARLQQQVAEDLYPVYVTLQTQEPAPGELPVPVPAPTLDDGPHVNYAGQWFIFAGLTAIVYPLLLRRNARHQDTGGFVPAESPDGPAGGAPPAGGSSPPAGAPSGSVPAGTDPAPAPGLR